MACRQPASWVYSGSHDRLAGEEALGIIEVPGRGEHTLSQHFD